MEPSAATPAARDGAGTALALFSVARILDFLLRLGIVPFFPELVERFDTTYAAVGVVHASFFAGYAALQLPFGWMADRWPEHRLVALGLIGVSASGLAFLAAETWQGAALARLGFGAAAAATMVPGTRMVATRTPPEGRGRAMGLLETAVGSSTLVAMAGFPLLAQWISFEHLLRVPALLSAPLAIAFLFLVPPARPEPRPAAPSRQHAPAGEARQVAALFLFGFLGLMALNAFMGWAPTYLREGLGFSPAAAAAVIALAQAVYIPAAYLSGHATDRLGRRIPLINTASVVTICAYLAMAFGHVEAALVYMGAVFYGIGGGSTMPALVTFATESLGPGRAGLATGLMQLAAQLGATVAGVVYGAIVDLTGDFSGIWWLGAGLLAARVVSSRLAVEPARTITSV